MYSTMPAAHDGTHCADVVNARDSRTSSQSSCSLRKSFDSDQWYACVPVTPIHFSRITWSTKRTRGRLSSIGSIPDTRT